MPEIEKNYHCILGTKKWLVDIIEDKKCYHKVRCEGCHALIKVLNVMPSASKGPPALLVIFKKLFGSFANSSIVMQNDFSSLQKYFLQKEIPLAMAALRNSHNICPPEVIRFLLDLFKYNDNSKNTFSDNYYRAAMVEALGETVTPVVSVLQVCTIGWAPWNLSWFELKFDGTRLSSWYKNRNGPSQPCWLSQFRKAKLRQPIGQRSSKQKFQLGQPYFYIMIKSGIIKFEFKTT